MTIPSAVHTIPTITVTGNGVNRVVPAGEYLVIGSASSSDLYLKHPFVSRRHALIGFKDGWFIEDLGSTNGTFIAAQPVARSPIVGPTEVFLGDSERGERIVLDPGHTSESLYPSYPDDLLVSVGPPPDLRPYLPDSSQSDLSPGLSVRDLRFVVGKGKVLVNGVSLDAPRGSLTAVVGPSGAGKSTFASLVAGVNVPTSGQIVFDGLDVVGDYAHAKSHIGMVPQDDVIHRGLKLGTALKYAAKLRLGHLSEQEQQARIHKAVGQLDLEPHLATKIDRLSGGQRKRASVAMEMLTEPELLILDEPTSGLDPALDRQLMHEFRKLANGGRSVLVITHSVAHLGLCDQVLVLAPGGFTAFTGPEAEALEFFDTDDWSTVFADLQHEGDRCSAQWRAEAPLLPPPMVTAQQAPASDLSQAHFFSQMATLVKRQIALLAADRGYSLFLLALPFVVGLLPLVVPGDAGLTQVQTAENSQEPQVILALLIIGALFMGISMSIRDLVGERSIYLRERAVNLLPSAYLASKFIVFGLLSWIGALIMVVVVGVVKDAPTTDGILGFGSLFELFLSLGFTISSGMVMGLLLSSLVTSQAQVMPVLIVVLMVQMVMNGGLITLTGNRSLNIFSYFTPARWAFAMAAVSLNLPQLLEIADENDRALLEATKGDPDPLWAFETEQWYLAAGVLVAMSVVLLVLTWIRLRSTRR